MYVAIKGFDLQLLRRLYEGLVSNGKKKPSCHSAAAGFSHRVALRVSHLHKSLPKTVMMRVHIRLDRASLPPAAA